MRENDKDQISETRIEDYRSYLGNENIKRRGVHIEWTEEMAAEYIKCKYDPGYFIRNYIYVVHVDRGFIPIEPYDYQEEIVEKVSNNRKVVVVTSRQAGKTTTAMCLIVHFVIFNNHKRVALLANDGAAAREILERIKDAYEALPKWMQQGVIEWNKGTVELENGSKIIAAATTSTSIRGKSIALLYIDEAAYVENWDEFFRSVYPTISSGDTTKILLTSTPNGLNHFYKTVTNAKKKGTDDWNGYEIVEVTWDRVPGRGQSWKKETLEAMDFDYDAFNVEYCCEFAGSSGTLISGSALKELTFIEPLVRDKNINVYANPINGHSYVMIADVSRGKGLDYSAFHIIDVTKMPYKQVCVFRDNLITPVDYASMMFTLAKHYNEASVLVEINDNGEQVATHLYHDYEYENMLFTSNNGRSGKKLIMGFSGESDKGVRTTKTVKARGCSMLKLLIEQKQLILYDLNTIKELSTFSRKGISYEAESGCNDDLAMGLVLFAWLSDQKFFRELTDIYTLENLRDYTEEQMLEQLIPFGIVSDGHEYHEEEIPKSSKDDSFLFF